MKDIFRCTHITSERTEDLFDEGLVGKFEVPYEGHVNLEAPTLKELLVEITKKIGRLQTYKIDITEVSLLVDADEDNIDTIIFYRQETEDGKEPSEEHTERWKKGEVAQFEAHYEFTIQHIKVCPITMDELKQVVSVDWP